ncbi:MAG: chemotaxis protein CheX [Verrucomicrobiota bacterium]
MDISEKELEKFIDISCGCFEKMSPKLRPLEPQEPTIELNQTTFLDFTGIIELSQRGRKGKICLTMPEDMLDEVLDALGETQHDAESQSDLIGELTSIISSNAREHFGSSLSISVPSSMTHMQTGELELAPMRFILPLKLKEFTSYLIIALGGQNEPTA